MLLPAMSRFVLPDRSEIVRMSTLESIWIVALMPALSAQAPKAAAPVEVAEVVERRVATTVELVGTVLPLRRSIVASGADGLVVEFAVREGDLVKEHQMLARLRTRTLEIEREAASAALDEKQQLLAELEAGSRPEEIERTRAVLAAAEARARLAVIKRDRLERLVARDAASGEDLEEAAEQVVETTQEVARLKADHELAKQGPRSEQLAQGRARVEAARAALRRVEDDIEKRTVRAPFAGYVVREHTQVGQWLGTESPVVEMVDLGAVEVQVMVPEKLIHELRAGQATAVHVEALGDRQLAGQIAGVVPQADVRARQFPVRVRISNEVDDGRPLLQAGMFARVQLPVGGRHMARLVPKDALVLQAGRSVVFVAERTGDSHKVTPVTVRPGAAHDGLVEADGNLKPGQLVVVRGNERLAAGQTVQVESQLDAKPTAENNKPTTVPAESLNK